MGDTDAQKRAKSRWKRENMQFFGARMRNEEAEAYRAVCAKRGLTPNGYLLQAARALIAEDAANTPDAPTCAEDADADAPTL